MRLRIIGLVLLATTVACQQPRPRTIDVTLLAVGHSHSVAMLADGSIHVWGRFASGEESDVPVEITGFTNVVTALQAATRACGRNDRGQLGDGTKDDRHEPVPVRWP